MWRANTRSILRYRKLGILIYRNFRYHISIYRNFRYHILIYGNFRHDIQLYPERLVQPQPSFRRQTIPGISAENKLCRASHALQTFRPAIDRFQTIRVVSDPWLPATSLTPCRKLIIQGWEVVGRHIIRKLPI